MAEIRIPISIEDRFSESLDKFHGMAEKSCNTLTGVSTVSDKAGASISNVGNGAASSLSAAGSEASKTSGAIGKMGKGIGLKAMAGKALGKVFQGIHSVVSKIKDAGKGSEKAIGGMGEASGGLFTALQKAYYAMQAIQSVSGPIKSAIDEISSKMKSAVMYGAEAGGALYEYSKKAANEFGRSSAEVGKAVMEWANLGAGSESIEKLSKVADKFAKFTNENNFENTASRLTDAIKNKSVSGMADMLGGGESVEKKLNRKGMTRALNRGDIQGALKIYEEVADELGYTDEKAKALNNTLSNKLKQAADLLRNKVMDIATRLAEKVEPVVSNIVDYLSSSEVQNSLDRISNALSNIADILVKVVTGVIGFVSRNAEILKTAVIFAGVVIAIIKIHAAVTALKAAFVAAKVIMSSAFFPVIAVIAGVAGALMITQAIVESVTGESCSFIEAAIMLISGLVTGLLVTIVNIVHCVVELIFSSVALIYNFVASWVEFFVNLFNDPIGAIAGLFAGLAETALGFLRDIVGAMNKIFGSEKLTEIENWFDSVNKKAQDTAAEYQGESYKKIDKVTVADMSKAIGWGDRSSYGETYDTISESLTKGASFLGSKFDAFLGKNEVVYTGLLSGVNGFMAKLDKLFGSKNPLDSSESGKILKDNTAKIASNTKRMTDLSWMKELASRSFINNVNVRTMAPNVNVKVSNTNATGQQIGKALEKELLRMQSAGAKTSHGGV